MGTSRASRSKLQVRATCNLSVLCTTLSTCLSIEAGFFVLRRTAYDQSSNPHRLRLLPRSSVPARPRSRGPPGSQVHALRALSYVRWLGQAHDLGRPRASSPACSSKSSARTSTRPSRRHALQRRRCVGRHHEVCNDCGATLDRQTSGEPVDDPQIVDIP